MIEYTNITKDLPESVPFVGPESQERNLGFSFLARLGANESVFGPSNDAIKIMARESKNIWKYGDPESYDLRRELADKHLNYLEKKTYLLFMCIDLWLYGYVSVFCFIFKIAIFRYTDLKDICEFITKKQGFFLP